MGGGAITTVDDERRSVNFKLASSSAPPPLLRGVSMAAGGIKQGLSRDLSIGLRACARPGGYQGDSDNIIIQDSGSYRLSSVARRLLPT